MIRRLNRPLGGAALAVVAAVVVSASTPAYAAGSGDVKVVNTETVQVYTSPTGEVKTKMVYEQTSLTGHGTADIANPVSTDNLRNLDGFGKPEVKNGQEITRTTVDGTKKLRSVSDFNGKLPLEVSVAYTLDGKPVKPADVVGASGRLDVKFTVKNVTAKKQVVTFKDGKGNTVTKTDDVPIPMVATVDTVAPSSFTTVKSVAANMGGDGHGGTAMKFLLTLFPPIGSDTAVFGYSADIKHGVVPRAEITAVPVNPLTSPTYATAASSYQGGVDSGTQVTDGAIQIDTNLLKLRDGAATLLAGLIKLRNGAGDLQAGLAGQALPGSKKLASGASQLSDGLNNTAVPGSKKLASGADDLSAGLGQLNSGARRLAAGNFELSGGADQLAAGTKKAASGSKQLADGADQVAGGAGDVANGAATVNGGMEQLASGQGDLLQGLQLLEAGVKALPKTVQDQLATDPQYQALLGGMQKVIDGIGEPTDVTDPATGEPATLFGGLNAIQKGLQEQVSPALGQMISGIPAKQQGLTCASLILTDLTGGADAPNACFPGGQRPPLTDESSPVNIAVLKAMAGQLTDGVTGLDQLSGGLAQIKGAVDNQFVPGLSKVKGGLVNPNANPNCAIGAATPDKTDDCGVKQAVSFFKANIPVLVDSITASISKNLLASISEPPSGCTPTTQTLICGATQLATGGAALADGTSKLATGAGDLSAGASLLSDKSGELATGLGQINDGAGTLAAGGRKLAAGSADLANGAGQADAGSKKVAKGADDLSDGLGTAADGSTQVANGASDLSDGIGTAADGSIKLHNGLITAAGGAPQLENGAQQLSTQGTQKLIAGGNDTTAQYAELNAVLAAGAKRATTEDMAFGAPKGAMGLTAYNFIVNGQNSEDSHNLARGLGGLALLGAGGAVFAMRRRLV